MRLYYIVRSFFSRKIKDVQFGHQFMRIRKTWNEFIERENVI